MLSLRIVRRFCHISSAAVLKDSPSVVTNHILDQKPLQEPALIRLKAERDPEKLFKLFKDNARNRVVIENRFAFEDTVSRLAGAGRFDYIENLLEQQKELPQGKREGFVVRLMMLYGKAGMTRHAIVTYYNMHLHGCKRTVKSFNAALKILMECHDFEAIKMFLAEATEKYGIKFDIFSVNTIVKAFCEMGILEKAYLIMVQMEKLGISPDVITYTTLISAFYKHRRFEIANGLWNLMVHKRCLPNIFTFNARIQHLVSIRRAWDANDLLLLMRKVGIKPDEVSYNLVIKGFCQARYFEMGRRVYSALRVEGINPNIRIYQTMIHYMCASGEFDLAYTMCQDCMKRNWFPNVNTIYMLLDGLKKSGRLGKANMIMSSVRKRSPPFPSNQLDSMQSLLSRS